MRKVLGGVVCNELSLVDNNDLVADRLHLGQDMRGKNYGVVLSELLDERAYLDYLLRVKTYGRLVEYQHLGIPDQRLSQTHTLLVALGKVADNALLHIGDLHEAAYLIEMGALRKPALFQVVHEIKVLHDGHVKVQRRKLRQIADAFLCLLRLLQDIVAVDQHLALRRCQIAGDDVHGR